MEAGGEPVKKKYSCGAGTAWTAGTSLTYYSPEL